MGVLIAAGFAFKLMIELRRLLENPQSAVLHRQMLEKPERTKRVSSSLFLRPHQHHESYINMQTECWLWQEKEG